MIASPVIDAVVNKDDPSHSPVKSYLISALVAFIEQFVELNILIRSKFALDSQATTARAGAFASAHRGKILADHITATEVKLRKALHINPLRGQFSVNNPGLSVESYLEFWRLVVRTQERLKKTGRAAMKVRAIHSTPVELWLTEEPAIKEILKLHRDFRALDGEVVRILIDHGGQPGMRPTGDYERAMARMVTYGTDVRYLCPSPALRKKLATWDFLLVGHGTKDEAVIWQWDKVDAGGSPHKTVFCAAPYYYSSDEDQEPDDLDELWRVCIEELPAQ